MACLLLLAAALLQRPAPPPPVEPPEEDASLTVKEYSFNPLQAVQELKVGNFYFKRGAWKAAAGRFEEATKWNPQLSDAWLRLGEVRARLKDPKGARAAYEKFLELAPDAKNARDVRRRIGNLR